MSKHSIRLLCCVRGVMVRVSLRWFSRKQGTSRVLGCNPIQSPACSSSRGIRADSPRGKRGKGRDRLLTALAGTRLRFLPKGSRDPAAGTVWAIGLLPMAWEPRRSGPQAPQEQPTASPSPPWLPRPRSLLLSTLPCIATALGERASRPTTDTTKPATRRLRTLMCLLMCDVREEILK